MSVYTSCTEDSYFTIPNKQEHLEDFLSKITLQSRLSPYQNEKFLESRYYRGLLNINEIKSETRSIQ